MYTLFLQISPASPTKTAPERSIKENSATPKHVPPVPLSSLTQPRSTSALIYVPTAGTQLQRVTTHLQRSVLKSVLQSIHRGYKKQRSVLGVILIVKRVVAGGRISAWLVGLWWRILWRNIDARLSNVMRRVIRGGRIRLRGIIVRYVKRIAHMDVMQRIDARKNPWQPSWNKSQTIQMPTF